MAASVRTVECYPTELRLGDLLLPAPSVDHEHCPGGQTTPGVLGGWRCPCPCHRRREIQP